VRPRRSRTAAALGAIARGVALLILWAGIARASEPSTSAVLREGNMAALAGDWPRVALLVEPLLSQPLATSDLAEAHRLAGIAAFFHQHVDDAERHFLVYLHSAPAGRLDPALYPPDVVTFFNDVASRHAGELTVARSPPRRSWWLTLAPPFGQLQNGERTKAYVLGGVLGALLVTNLTTYYFLNKWCQVTDGREGSGLTCYNGGDHNHIAARVRPTNVITGIGFLVVYAYGVADAMWGYRKRSRDQAVQPFVDASADVRVFGVMGRL